MTTLYDESFARRYRAHDDALDDSAPYLNLVHWLQSVCAGFDGPFDALDLGCGTGRYFWAIQRVRSLVGLDASRAMLDEAAHPVHVERMEAGQVTLAQGDLATYDFPAGSFDLVYSIGVLAEHVPFDECIVSRVHRWLRPAGRFAFTTVHPDSPTVPRTLRRRLARAAAQVAPAAILEPLRDRLLSGGRYADERRIRELLDGRFAIEALEPFQSEAPLQCRTLARKIV